MIEVLGVKKRYRKKQVIEEVSFTAQKGEITCLIGLNGTGKSTILKGIMGLTPFDQGTVLVDGKPIDLNRVAFVPDHSTFPIHFTIEQCEAFMRDFYPKFDPKLFARLVDEFKLFPEDKLNELSKGTLAKVNLALGIAQDPDYLLLDEPFSGIDVFSKEQIVELFSSDIMQDRGVLITTHEIEDIEYLVDKAVMLNRGRIVREFDVEDVRFIHGKSIVDVMREEYGA
ncbi:MULTISPECIES: ABC transporter ATP-binding protein [unclassified Exiguobacterium]|uniref:ABC transporter ATP-binding protein n=1 Tax=unclassified Exiguobacterium TaxID=2644629 RepID=UPI00103BAEE1|nr:MULTISPECIES: ABC transporter ATP-binding protein [unclassified Exiguobacterium]TCI68305.1 ABC transporter ATP-binding protein [Exiguobacterium sp. IPCI3]TCI77544.1 ABC transporter ATP-binding protein [Exiguobacterium sp. IPCH1]TCI79118.1 ABC transporter ATP-binding protein [Exiguobacterium sp. IPBC4]